MNCPKCNGDRFYMKEKVYEFWEFFEDNDGDCIGTVLHDIEDPGEDDREITFQCFSIGCHAKYTQKEYEKISKNRARNKTCTKTIN